MATGNRLRFSDLPPEAQVAWDRDMAIDPWQTKPFELYDFSEHGGWFKNGPRRYVAWSPQYPSLNLAVFIIDECRWVHREEWDERYANGWKGLGPYG